MRDGERNSNTAHRPCREGCSAAAAEHAQPEKFWRQPWVSCEGPAGRTRYAAGTRPWYARPAREERIAKLMWCRRRHIRRCRPRPAPEGAASKSDGSTRGGRLPPHVAQLGNAPSRETARRGYAGAGHRTPSSDAGRPPSAASIGVCRSEEESQSSVDARRARVLSDAWRSPRSSLAIISTLTPESWKSLPRVSDARCRADRSPGV